MSKVEQLNYRQQQEEPILKAALREAAKARHPNDWKRAGGDDSGVAGMTIRESVKFKGQAATGEVTFHFPPGPGADVRTVLFQCDDTTQPSPIWRPLSSPSWHQD